jgi:X-X-X-Leu-X-X-Gly heptad repeat protein
LTPIEVQTLVTADLEGEVSNSRLQLVRNEHSVELTKMLQGLTSRGFLEQIGLKRGSSYRLPLWASPLASGASPLTAGTPPLTAGTSPLAAGASPVSNPLLLEIARPAREKKKLVPELTKRLIQRLCQNEPLTAEQLGELLDRRKEKLQENFLAQMVANGELQLRYPDQLTHPEQAYRTNPNWSKS